MGEVTVLGEVSSPSRAGFAAGAWATVMGCTMPPFVRRMRFSPSANSSSAGPVSLSKRASLRTSSSSTSNVGIGAFFSLSGIGKTLRQGFERQGIAERPRAANHGRGRLRHVRMMAEFLPPVNVGDMHFDHRNAATQQRIEQADGGVRQRTGVNDDSLVNAAGFLNPFKDFAFMIALAEIDRHAQFVRAFLA